MANGEKERFISMQWCLKLKTLAKISLLTTLKKWRQGMYDVEGRCWQCNALECGVEPKANDTFEHMFSGYVICLFLPSIMYSKYRDFFYQFKRNIIILSLSSEYDMK